MHNIYGLNSVGKLYYFNCWTLFGDICEKAGDYCLWRLVSLDQAFMWTRLSVLWLLWFLIHFRFYLVYFVFYILGLGSLSPWNFFITASDVSFSIIYEHFPTYNRSEAGGFQNILAELRRIIYYIKA